MKRYSSTSRTVSAVVCLLICNGYYAFSQTTMTSNSNEDDKASVSLVVSEFNQAMVDRDQATLEVLTLDELSYGHSSGKIENKEAFIHEVVNGDFDFVAINTENQTVLLSGEDTAVVRHILLIEGISMSEKVNVRIGNVLVFKKQQNQWKLLARQAYKF